MMIRISGLHLLLTFQCTYECDHCFVWGSPKQSGVMTLRQVIEILAQASAAGVQEVYFEGGEPFLYYPLLRRAVLQASDVGLRVGIVTNAYWATSPEDALEALRPFVGRIQDLSVSSDLFHANERISLQARYAAEAAQRLGIPCGLIQVAQPECDEAYDTLGRIAANEGEAGLMFRGRAVRLAERVAQVDWRTLDTCPHENLVDPGRLHVDPLGYVHLCQGIALGNLFQESLVDILNSYEPFEHPIAGVLLQGGPTELARCYHVSTRPAYADECHLCDQVRRALRTRFPHILVPDQMYGVGI